MHFDPNQFPGNSIFWQMLYVYWMSFTLETRLMLGGYIFVLLYIAARGSRKAKLFFVASFIIMLLICLNPWMCRYLVDKWGFFTRYFRFFWLIPVSMGYTYVAVELYDKYKSKSRVILCVTLAVLFAWSCVCVVKQTGFPDVYTGSIPNTGMIPVSNIYKVEDEVVEATALIEADSGNPYVDKKTLYNRDVFIEMRTYDASLIPMFNYGMVSSDRNMETAIAESDYISMICIYFSGNTDGVTDSNVSSELLKTAMDNTDCQYVILPNDNYYMDYWKGAFTELGVAGRYTVFKVK